MPTAPIAEPATVLMLLGTAIALLSLPLLLRRIPPNRYYGIRLAAAFRSERHWYEINTFGARRFILFGIVVAAMGLALHAYTAVPFWLPIACMVLTLVLLLLTVQSIKRYAEKRFPL